MAERIRTKYQDIPFIIDGVAKIVKSVTSQTTCCDVINKLPKLSTPVAVFLSVNGEEKELSSKTKLLKVWRSHSSSQKVVFVIRRSEAADKLKKSRSTFFGGDRKRCEQHSVISHQEKTKDRLKQFSSFIKEKKQRINRRLSEGPSFLHSTMKKSSTSMALESTRISTVLDKSTASTTQKPRQIKRQTSRVINIKQRDTIAIIDALNTKKLGLKSRFQTSSKTSTQRTSAGSLGSSDTGYTSGSSGAQRTTQKPATFQTRLLEDSESGPRHSTPIGQHTRKRRITELDNTLNEEFDELRGKSMILRKFMEDQEVYGSPTSTKPQTIQETNENKRRRTDNRLSLPAFTTQEDKCRYLWNQYCDSESECSEDSFLNTSQMDMAFLESFDFDTTYMESVFTNQRKHKLRRESAISNLNRFSLYRKEAEITEEDEDSYDYSFDCSFQRFDETQAAELRTEFDQQFENNNNNNNNDDDNNSDISVDSFMNSRTELGEADGIECGKLNTSLSESDEGIGSSSSGSIKNGLVC